MLLSPLNVTSTHRSGEQCLKIQVDPACPDIFNKFVRIFFSHPKKSRLVKVWLSFLPDTRKTEVQYSALKATTYPHTQLCLKSMKSTTLTRVAGIGQNDWILLEWLQLDISYSVGQSSYSGQSLLKQLFGQKLEKPLLSLNMSALLYFI